MQATIYELVVQLMCSTSGPKASGLTVYTLTLLSNFGHHNARQNSDLMATSLTNRKVLERTSILQMKATPLLGCGWDRPFCRGKAAVRALACTLWLEAQRSAPVLEGPVPSHQLCLNPPSRKAHTFCWRNQNFFLGCAKLRTAAKGPCTQISCSYSHQEWIPGERV